MFRNKAPLLLLIAIFASVVLYGMAYLDFVCPFSNVFTRVEPKNDIPSEFISLEEL